MVRTLAENEVIYDAVNKVRYISTDVEERREFLRNDIIWRENDARRFGRKEERAELVDKMKAAGLSEEEVIRILATEV